MTKKEKKEIQILEYFEQVKNELLLEAVKSKKSKVSYFRNNNEDDSVDVAIFDFDKNKFVAIDYMLHIANTVTFHTIKL